jgi:hypothetical protein
LKRARIPARIPVHVTVRISEEVESLRTHSALKVVARAIWQAQDKFGMRITHFTLESNHLHLIVEGLCAAGMKGLGVRIAKGIHRLRGTSGAVIGDRYFPRPLRSPPQVKNAIHYVLYNHKHHTGLDMPDEFCSALLPQVVVEPETWLLRNPAPRRRRR